MRLTFAIQHHVTCRSGKCNATVPVNAIAESVTCRACTKVTKLPVEYWQERFGREYRPWNARVGDTEASALRGIGTIASYLRYGVEDPVCGHGACRAPIEVGATACTACGARIAVRPAGALDKLIDPHATFVVGEDPAVAEQRTIHVVCEYDEDAYRAYRWNLVRERLADAALPLDPPSLLAKLARDDRSDVRAVVAENAATPPDALAGLTRDDNSTVRAAVVANPATPADALAALAKIESAEEVLHALVGRHVLPPVVVEALATASSSHTRMLAVKRAELSHATLRALERDNEDRVRRAAAQRIRDLEKAGTRVEGGGWFKKLFGG